MINHPMKFGVLPLPAEVDFVAEFPLGAEILGVEVIGKGPHLTYLAPDTMDREQLRVKVFMAGVEHDLSELQGFGYVGMFTIKAETAIQQITKGPQQAVYYVYFVMIQERVQ